MRTGPGSRTDIPGNIFAFENSYAGLPERFYSRLAPQPVSSPRLIRANDKLADFLGLDPDLLTSHQGIEIMAGNMIAPGSMPLAMAYAGHQFGGWVPSLGDGRAILLGEIRGKDGTLHDIQLKGSGRTPYSRSGDGRAGLGPVLREYLVSEAMHALSVPTTRTLAAVTTGETVYRERPLPGAILVRVATCHIRVGTFQYYFARNDIKALKVLADYLVDRVYPHLLRRSDRYLGLLETVMAGQAELVARWLSLGFIHGVMNTDNMSLACETIDYGPCAFMDTFSARKVFSSIDHSGRYAYDNQPLVAHWNLAQFATCLLPLIDEDTDTARTLAIEALDRYPELHEAAWMTIFRKKLGLYNPEEDDRELARSLLQAMEAGGVDFTIFFRSLADRQTLPGQGNENIAKGEIGDWLHRWHRRLARESVDPEERSRRMRAVNPKYIPRNHQVEKAIALAENGDFSRFDLMVETLAHPFNEQPDSCQLSDPPHPSEIVTRTFCGT